MKGEQTLKRLSPFLCVDLSVFIFISFHQVHKFIKPKTNSDLNDFNFERSNNSIQSKKQINVLSVCVSVLYWYDPTPTPTPTFQTSNKFHGFSNFKFHFNLNFNFNFKFNFLLRFSPGFQVLNLVHYQQIKKTSRRLISSFNRLIFLISSYLRN